jgi:hypothetical protein
MLDDIREQRDRWQHQAGRLAALAIMARLPNLRPCLIGMEACVGAHLSR